MAVKGDKELVMALKSLGARAPKAISQGVYATANQVRGDAIKSIMSESMGTYVTRYSQDGNPYDHIAAKPGAAPNNDTGDLVESISVEPETPSETMFVGSSLNNPPYGLYLEVGTKHMEPRPWLQPALDANIGNLTANITKAVKRLINERK